MALLDANDTRSAAHSVEAALMSYHGVRPLVFALAFLACCACVASAKVSLTNYVHRFPSGQLQVQGQLLCQNGESPTGLWRWYFSNGHFRATGEYNTNGWAHGQWNFFYESGTNALSAMFVDNEFSSGDMWFPTGQTRGSWQHTDTPFMLEETLYDRTGRVTRRGILSLAEYGSPRIGIWEVRHVNGQWTKRVEYNSGTETSVQLQGADGAVFFEGTYLEFLRSRYSDDRLGWIDGTPPADVFAIGRTLDEIESDLGPSLSIFPTVGFYGMRVPCDFDARVGGAVESSAERLSDYPPEFYIIPRWYRQQGKGGAVIRHELWVTWPGYFLVAHSRTRVVDR